MKILIYSDLHISKTSSILPQIDSIYTYRQDMILKTGKYLKDIIIQYEPDLIVNLGDTFDQATLTSYDITTASEFFNNFAEFNIPHIVIVGNHEMLNENYNAVSLLQNIQNIQLITTPTILYDNLVFIPYQDKIVDSDLLDAKFMFSHLDIQGSEIRNGFTLPTGLTKEQLSKYNLVFNGHIHKPSIFGNIVNVGSISTHSFSDDENSVPQAYIFDAETLDLKILKPHICPLFRKARVETKQELDSYIKNLDSNYRYVLHCVCPFEIKDDVKEYLDNNEKVLASRLNVVIQNKNAQVVEDNVEINLKSNIDVKHAFTSFLDGVDLKYPKELYLNILEEVNNV